MLADFASEGMTSYRKQLRVSYSIADNLHHIHLFAAV
jgi:hypothetical protein